MANVQALDGTGYSYVRGDKNVVFSNGVMMPIEVFDALQNSGDVVREILKRKDAGEIRYDFNAAASNKKLVPLTVPGVQKEVNKPVVEVKIKKENVSEVKESIQEHVEMPTSAEKRSFW